MKKWYNLLMAVIVITLNHSAYAAVFDDGLVHAIDYYVSSGTVIADNISGEYTTVDIYTGAKFMSYVSSEGNSHLNVYGGGFYSSVDLRDSSIANISGGNFRDHLRPYDNSTVTISGDTTVAEFYAGGSSTVNITGGTFTNYFFTGGSASTIESGIFNCDVGLGGNTVVNGGDFNNGVMTLVGDTEISGGIYSDYVFCTALSSLSITGGDFGGYIMVEGLRSLVTLSGSDFTINGQECTEGSFATDYYLDSVSFSNRECLTGIVTGVLSDGTAFNQTIYLSDLALGRGDIQFIPEPASMWLLLLSGGWLVRRKR